MPSPLHHRSSGGSPPPRSQPQPQPKAKQKVLSLILKGIIMTFITTVFFLLLGLASFLLFNILLFTAAHRHLGRRAHHVHHRDNPSNGFCPKQLKKLPQFKFSNGVDCECVVCLCGIGQGQWCRRLVSCGHVFHRKCVDLWLLKAPTCPICRTRVRLDRDGGGGGEPSTKWNFVGTNLRVC